MIVKQITGHSALSLRSVLRGRGVSSVTGGCRGNALEENDFLLDKMFLFAVCGW